MECQSKKYWPSRLRQNQDSQVISLALDVAIKPNRILRPVKSDRILRPVKFDSAKGKPVGKDNLAGILSLIVLFYKSRYIYVYSIMSIPVEISLFSCFVLIGKRKNIINLKFPLNKKKTLSFGQNLRVDFSSQFRIDLINIIQGDDLLYINFKPYLNLKLGIQKSQIGRGYMFPKNFLLYGTNSFFHSSTERIFFIYSFFFLYNFAIFEVNRINGIKLMQKSNLFSFRPKTTGYICIVCYVHLCIYVFVYKLYVWKCKIIYYPLPYTYYKQFQLDCVDNYIKFIAQAYPLYIYFVLSVIINTAAQINFLPSHAYTLMNVKYL